MLQYKYLKMFEKTKDFLLSKIADLQLVYVFGSFASQKNNSQSDIDVAIYTSKKIDPVKLFQIKNELANLLNTEVDLLDIRSVSEVVNFQIVNTGKVIYQAQDFLKDELELQIIQKYFQLNDDRKEILDKILKQKSVYG